MYAEHPLFKSPGEDESLWRYMDFTKFVSLLEGGAIYFNRADKFDDAFEGRHPKASIEYFLDSYREVLKATGANDAVIDSALSATLGSLSINRATVGISCWHKNEHESAAMWKLYLSSREGVAIKTRFSRLKSSFIDCSPEVLIGEVQYIDYDKSHVDFNNMFCPFLHKRMSFEHEREVRALVWRSDLVGQGLNYINESFGYGVSVSCNLDILIEEVYVAPTSPQWFRELVASMLNRFELKAPVRQSRLDELPY
ncbi:hypothetical protein ACSQ5K_16440 [Pseudomonas sp. PhalM4]